jgi:hypothetical protein
MVRSLKLGGVRRIGMDHAMTPLRYSPTPASDVAAKVGSVPVLNRNTATIAAVDSSSAHGSRLANTGASKRSGPASIGATLRNKVWTANQIARLRMTPTTAAVIADKAPATAVLLRSRSMNGAPRKIHRKHVSSPHRVVQIDS